MSIVLARVSDAQPDPVEAAAHEIGRALRSDGALQATELFGIMADTFGTRRGDGDWSARHAFDVCETSALLHLLDPGTIDPSDRSPKTLEWLRSLQSRLPTQSVRSETQIALQQFSTPLALAWLAGLAAAPTRNDVVLEPSAGTGLLAFHASNVGSRLILNEIDAFRSRCLAIAYPQAQRFAFDAELIDDLLPSGTPADVILINPPFARSVGRGEDAHAASRHLASAWRCLRSGGRLVAIVPHKFEAPAWAAAQAERGTILLDTSLMPGVFAKHGTGIAVRLLVIDKAWRCDVSENPCGVASLGDLLARVIALPPRLSPLFIPEKPRSTLGMFKRTAGPAARSLRPNSPLAAAPLDAMPLVVRTLPEPATTGEPVGLYLPWRASRMTIEGAADHPTPLVESIAMGSIAAPAPRYAPLLPASVVSDGLLSEAQLETLVYAGGAFDRDLPGSFRPIDEGAKLEPTEDGARLSAGFFLGDGTGAGKGRQVAGIILDQWLQGRRRHIWLSKNEALLEDARRDWTALGGLALDIQPLSQWKLGAPLTLDAGVLFVTYPTLRSGREDATRLQQILDWAGAAFDGVIAFDEAHALANAADGEGSRGKIKGSEQGIAGVRLQNLLPRARVLYVSATGASDVANLSYATRLGLWGPSTAFADRDAFVGAIRSGGIAAMELVARDLKALGIYTARALSFAGVEYDLLEHELTPAQIAIYDAYSEAWAIVHRNLKAALETTRIVDAETGATLNANAKGAALSRFESVKQRFFAQLLLSMKLPSLLPAMATDLANGHAVVVQLVSTSEAMLDRRLADLEPHAREALELDLSPREYVVDYLTRAFPTRQMRVFEASDGSIVSEPMVDEDGHAVHCRAAIEARDTMVEQLCALPPIATALDAIIGHFGTAAVAEVTGRTKRLVLLADGSQKLERRSPRANLIETQAFMDGAKRVLVFSDAGGTGRSYHACLKAKNQARRIHYLLEPGWRADAAIQGLGRTHRSAQASAPWFRPVTTNVRGERRFISTIARRLDALGALTRGQRQTGGQNLFDPADNLESSYAKDALSAWYRLLYAGKMASIGYAEFQERSGLNLESPDGGLRDDLPPIQRWLNRLLAFPIALQNAIFDEFLGLVEARVEAARSAGTLDIGVETLRVESYTIAEDRTIRTDTQSGATTHLLKLELARRTKVLDIDEALDLADRKPNAALLINARSGRVAVRIEGRNLMDAEGGVIKRYELIRPCKRERIDVIAFAETSWKPTSRSVFADAWEAEANEAAATLHRETLYLATGLLLPIWDKFGDDHVQVLRVVDASGASLIGREVPALDLAEFGTRLGLDLDPALAPAELAALVMSSGKTLRIGATALHLKRALVGGEQRLELTGFEPARLPEYKALGCFTEIIRYQTRLFAPVARAAEIVTKLAA
jgi:predicted RNA methylase